jgi:hypothetical protein
MARQLPLALVALLVLSSAPGLAQDERIAHAGIDLWTTDNPSFLDFSDNPAPTNFFGCNETFDGQVIVKGKPILASAPLGTADTILHRLEDIRLDGQTGLVIEALCLQNAMPFTDPCGKCWQVLVRLPDGARQPVGKLDAVASDPNGGTFTSEFSVEAEVLFLYPDGSFYGALPDTITLRTTSGIWRDSPAPGGVAVPGPVQVDRNCDGSLDASDPSLPGTSDFFPWIVSHDGPHAVTPPSESCDGRIDIKDFKEEHGRVEATSTGTRPKQSEEGYRCETPDPGC